MTRQPLSSSSFGSASGESTAEAIRYHGTRLLHERGYDGMSLRDLAQSVGIQPASLYNHIASKQQLLFILLRDYTQLMLETLQSELSEVGEPEAALRVFLSHHIRFHTSHPLEASICLSELRRLDSAGYAAVVGLRDSYQGQLEEIIDRGQRQGVFVEADTRLLTFAVLGMATSVLTWFKPEGRLDADAVVEAYIGLVLTGLRKA